MKNTVIQNNYEEVNNVKNNVALEQTHDIFQEVINMDHYTDIAKDVAASISAELKNKTFFTDDLELTQKQKDCLESVIVKLVLDCKNRYIEKLDDDERTIKIAQNVVNHCRKLIDLAFSAVSQEVNRGAIINGQAISASAANDKFNKMEFRYLSGDVTVPTNGVFISTNCLDIIENSILVEFNCKKTPEKVTVTDKVEKTPFDYEEIECQPVDDDEDTETEE